MSRYSSYESRGRYTPQRDEEGRFMSDDDYYYRPSLHGHRARRDYDEDRYASQYRPRDQYGRFETEDEYEDENGGRMYRTSGRYERDEDERYAPHRRSSSAQYRPRDEYGRFESEEDESDNGGYYRSSRSGRHAHGGWYGDEEGHSQAARKGWGEDVDYRSPRAASRRSSRYESDEDVDESGKIHHLRSQRRSSASSSHPGQGWHGDPQGHAEAGSHSHDNMTSARSGRSSRRKTASRSVKIDS